MLRHDLTLRRVELADSLAVEYDSRGYPHIVRTPTAPWFYMGCMACEACDPTTHPTVHEATLWEHP